MIGTFEWTGSTIGLIAAIGAAVILVLYFVAAYNGLVRLRNQAGNAWSQIDVQLKRRHDLIPNLIETAKGYMKFEQQTLTRITEARNLARGAKTVGEASQAESGLSQALGQFFVVVENYPDLKANQNFLALQEELTSTENKIGFARQFYNDQVMVYNTAIQQIPRNIVASIGGFMPKEFFEITAEAEREVPKVDFS
jgi:LemA protein